MKKVLIFETLTIPDFGKMYLNKECRSFPVP